MTHQKNVYDDVYKENDTLWDSSDKIIREIVDSDYNKKVIKLRSNHSKGFALNLGAGTGQNLDELNKYCDCVVLIDISKTGLLKAKNNHSSGEYIVADATKLPFKKGVFDYAEGIAILHHIPNYNDVFIELKQCMKEDCFMMFVEPGLLNPQAFIMRNFFPTPFHVQEEKPFIPFMLKNELKTIYGKDKIQMFHYNVLTYGASLISNANKIPTMIYKFARKIDSFIEKTPILKQLSGRMLILIEN